MDLTPTPTEVGMVLPDEVMSYGNDVANKLWENIQLTEADDSYDELTAYIYRWTIYLSVLALDVYESVLDLLRNNKLRAANMLTRPLIDYDVRLRYYVVQSAKARGALARDASIKLKHLCEHVDACGDWDNATFKLASILRLYDPADWPAEQSAPLLKILARNEKTRERHFRDMCAFLEKKEAKRRQIMPIFSDQISERYRAIIPQWLMQSAFLHGDQAAASDVIEDPDNPADSNVHRTSAGATPWVIFFTATLHTLEIIESISILRGWAIGLEQARNGATDLWEKFRADHPI
jgi:hypothetical protein